MGIYSTIIEPFLKIILKRLGCIMRSLRLTNAINGKILDFRELSEIDVSGENYIEV